MKNARVDETVLRRVPVGRRPVRNAIYRERAEIFVANAGENSVSIIPISDDEVAATIPVGVDPFRLLPVQAINGRDEMWVLDHGAKGQADGEISIVSGAGREVIGQIAVVGRPINRVLNTAGVMGTFRRTAYRATSCPDRDLRDTRKGG